MIIYGHVAKPSELTILYLDNIPGRYDRLYEFPAPEAVITFLDAHPEVEAVMFARSDMPRRAVAVEKARTLMPKMWRK